MSCKLNNTMHIDLIFNQLDMDTLDHMFRVGGYVNILSRGLRNFSASLSPGVMDELPLYGGASFYHDIGKAFVPLSIISKPDKFSIEERSIMEKHPLFAQVIFHDIYAGLIDGVPGMLVDLARDCAVFHHEWWNGEGYPYGIANTDIPFIARVTSVCDAYDAMTSNRVYGKARSHRCACRELLECSGTQFDPDIVKTFLKCENDIFLASNSVGSDKTVPHPVASALNNRVRSSFGASKKVRYFY